MEQQSDKSSFVKKDRVNFCDEQSNNYQRTKSRRNLLILGFSYMCCFSAYQAVLNLESSMNIEEGLGTVSVMVIFLTSAISCCTFVPLFIDFYGAKPSIIIGEIGFLVYIAANLYSSWYTLIPASIVHGLMESSPWAGTSVYVTYLGENRWSKKQNRVEAKPRETYVHQFFGHFYSFIYMGQLIGNVFTILFLFIFESTEHESSKIYNNARTNLTKGDSTTITIETSTKISIIDEKDISLCGAKDCQVNYIYSNNTEELKKYNPNPLRMYLMLSLFIIMCVGGIIAQAVYLVRTPAKFDKTCGQKSSSEHDQKDKTSMKSVRKKMIMEIKEIFFHLISPLNLLYSPIVFYYGLWYGYTLTEFTRAYISCTVGVKQLGVVLCLFCAICIITSLMSSTISRFIGRKGVVLLTIMFHMIFYLGSLFWEPNNSNVWALYALTIILGIGEALIMNVMQGLTATYFAKRLGIAFSAQNLIVNLGIVAVTSWSTSLCIYVKIYIQMGLFALSLVSLVGAEILYQKKRRLQNENCSDVK